MMLKSCPKIASPIVGSKSSLFFQTRQSSLATQLRREKLKANLKLPDDPDAPIIVFPRERLGNDYKVNWQFCFHDVVPTGEAYRNLYSRQLLQQAVGKADNKKAIHVNSDAPENFQHQIGESNPQTKSVSVKQYDQLFKDVKQHLSDVPSLFMHDAAVGSHQSASAAVRVITENSNIALYLSHMLPRLPLRQVETFPYNLVVYMDTSFQTTAARHGIQGKAFSLFNKDSNVLLVGGTASTQALSTALVQAVGTFFASQPEKNRVLLAGHSIQLENNKSVLLVDTENVYLKGKVNVKQINGAHNVIWTPEGVVRAWEGITSTTLDNESLKRGDLVEHLPNNAIRWTQSLPRANIQNHPSSVVFLVADSEGFYPTLSKLTATQAVQHLAAGFNGKSFAPFSGIPAVNPTATVASFKQLLAQSPSGAYIINTHQVPPADLQKLIQATTDGSASSPAAAGTGFSTLTPIKALGTLRMLPGNNAKEKTITSFLSSTYPNVTF